MIKLTDIRTNPLQPRQDFDRDKLQELANSIREGELLQPIVVRNNGNGYEIVAGERRFKAFQILKEPRIPSIILDIKDDTEALEKSLIENLQRDNLTSIERENAVGDLWDSKRYTTQDELSKKLGINFRTVSTLLNARDDRKKLLVKENISTHSLSSTAGLKDEPRKKLLQQVSNGKIEPDKILDIARKVKEFPEPEQQMEILEEFEEQEDMSREIFDDIIQKKKEIADGEREPEHIIEIETDSDKRLLDDYNDIKRKVFEIYSDHIQHLKIEENKEEAIQIIKEIISYLNKQLETLGENVVVDLDEKEKT